MRNFSVNGFIDYIENSSIPLRYYLFSFIFLISLRNFLEIFSDKYLPLTFGNIFHYDLSYAVLALAIILLINRATGEDIGKTTRIVLVSFVVLNIVPLADLLISLGKGYDIAYLRPVDLKDLAEKFITFFGTFDGKGITPGIRIELVIVLLGSFVYIYKKRRNFSISILYTIFVYVILFIYLSFPYFIKRFLSFFDLKFSEQNSQYIHFYLMAAFFLGLRYFFVKAGRLASIIIKDIRPFRLAHYLLMFMIGLALGSRFYPVSINENMPFSIFFIIISIVFVWIYSVMMNNISDVKIDSISNPDRPLISKAIDHRDYEYTANLVFILSLIFAGAAGFVFFFFILLFGGNYYLYSMRPFRLKRVPLLSKLVISGNSLILVMSGFRFVTGGLEFFPTRIALFFIVPFTLAVNFIDIKDFSGDKREGIMTIPVIFGLRSGKFIISVFFILAYAWSYFLLKIDFIIPFLIIFSLLQLYLINRKNYDEKYVFIVYLVSIIGGLASVLFFNIPLT